MSSSDLTASCPHLVKLNVNPSSFDWFGGELIRQQQLDGNLVRYCFYNLTSSHPSVTKHCVLTITNQTVSTLPQWVNAATLRDSVEHPRDSCPELTVG